jgi:hypothetical protein
MQNPYGKYKGGLVMTYSLTLPCGCQVVVACDPQTRFAHSRLIDRRGTYCQRLGHEPGSRVYLWDFLPDPDDTPDPLLPAAEPRPAGGPAFRTF